MYNEYFLDAVIWGLVQQFKNYTIIEIINKNYSSDISTFTQKILQLGESIKKDPAEYENFKKEVYLKDPIFFKNAIKFINQYLQKVKETNDFQKINGRELFTIVTVSMIKKIYEKQPSFIKKDPESLENIYRIINDHLHIAIKFYITRNLLLNYRNQRMMDKFQVNHVLKSISENDEKIVVEKDEMPTLSE